MTATEHLGFMLQKMERVKRDAMKAKKEGSLMRLLFDWAKSVIRSVTLGLVERAAANPRTIVEIMAACKLLWPFLAPAVRYG